MAMPDPTRGGMGAYSPAPIVTPQMHARIMRGNHPPTVAGMAKDGITYTGFLYAGVMIDEAGDPKTLEFNCRFGDPETQPIMMRLKSDLVDLVGTASMARLIRLIPSGTVASPLVWCLPRMATRTIHAKGDAIRGSVRRPRMRMCFCWHYVGGRSGDHGGRSRAVRHGAW